MAITTDDRRTTDGPTPPARPAKLSGRALMIARHQNPTIKAPNTAAGLRGRALYVARTHGATR